MMIPFLGGLRRCCLQLSSPPTWKRSRRATEATSMFSFYPSRQNRDNIEVNHHIMSFWTTSTSSSPTPFNLLVYGGLAASAATTISYHQNSGHQNGSHQKRDNARRYHRTVCCESNGSNIGNNDELQEKIEESDSFFDLAQQWANEVLSSKNNVASSTSDAASSTEIIDAPEEAFLYKLGIVGSNKQSSSTSALNERSSSSPDVKDQNNTVKQMMQSVFHKIQDEIQSSIPTSMSKTKQAAITADSSPNKQSETDTKSSDFLSFADNISSFFSRKSSNPDIDEIIQQAQNIANYNVSSTSSPNKMSSSSSGFLSQVLYFQQNAKSIQKILESSFGQYLPDHINLSDLFQSIPSIAALHYYLEYQDSIKTPSWKRRKHRFQPSVEVVKVNELNEALILSELSYADSVEDIRVGLDKLNRHHDDEDGNKSKKTTEMRTTKAEWELLFCDTQSRPNEPSHFLAIQKNASEYDDTLHLLMVVRGTKSMSDLMTDAMMEAIDYDYDGEQGKAHIGMMKSGEFLAARHQKLLSTLLHLSDKRKLDVTLIGHSLGAGAATIAAMKMNSHQFSEDIGKGGDNTVKVSANVIGFGCPALLSQNLSLMTRSYVTTVIADADMIPRMSGATLVNLLLDLRQFQYQEQAERDVEQALRELQFRLSDSTSTLVGKPIDEDAIHKVMGYVHRGIEKVSGEGEDVSKPSCKDESAEKMIPCLYPPGTCIHLFRDGSGIDGTYVPCTFFDEIDVARTMVDDHLISSGYRKIFLNMMRDFHKDDHFSFGSK